MGSEEGFGVWGLSGVGWGQEGALFAHFFLPVFTCFYVPGHMAGGGGVMVTFA